MIEDLLIWMEKEMTRQRETSPMYEWNLRAAPRWRATFRKYEDMLQVRYDVRNVRSTNQVRRGGGEEGKKVGSKKWTGSTITQMCHHFARGQCERGVYCTFAHSEAEIGQEWRDRGHVEDQSRRMVLCRFWGQGWQLLATAAAAPPPPPAV